MWLCIVTCLYSLTDKLWCGVQHGLKKFKPLLVNFTTSMSTLMLVLKTSGLITVFYRSLMSVLLMRRKPSKFWYWFMTKGTCTRNCIYIVRNHHFRLVKLLEQITGEKENKTIIFTETKKRADELTRGMRRAGWPAMVIHGDKSQQERDWVLKGMPLLKYSCWSMSA